MNDTQNFIDELYSSRDEDEILERLEFIRVLPASGERNDILDFLRSSPFDRVRASAEALAEELRDAGTK